MPVRVAQVGLAWPLDEGEGVGRYVGDDRIPGVVRRPGPAYGGRSALDAIAGDDQELVLAELRDAFDWAAAA
jgi:hypothetical protein